MSQGRLSRWPKAHSAPALGPLGHWAAGLEALQLTLIFAVAAFAFAVDRLTKNLVTARMHLGESIPVVRGIFHITYVRNAGAAFSLLQHQTVFFIIVTLVVIGLILAYGRTAARGDPWLAIALGLQLGGALGNLVDRVRVGSVVDFLDFRVWPVFNLADGAIVLGGGIFVYLLLSRGKSA